MVSPDSQLALSLGASVGHGAGMGMLQINTPDAFSSSTNGALGAATGTTAAATAQNHHTVPAFGGGATPQQHQQSYAPPHQHHHGHHHQYQPPVMRSNQSISSGRFPSMFGNRTAVAVEAPVRNKANRGGRSEKGAGGRNPYLNSERSVYNRRTQEDIADEQRLAEFKARLAAATQRQQQLAGAGAVQTATAPHEQQHLLPAFGVANTTAMSAATADQRRSDSIDMVQSFDSSASSPLRRGGGGGGAPFRPSLQQHVNGGGSAAMRPLQPPVTSVGSSSVASGAPVVAVSAAVKSGAFRPAIPSPVSGGLHGRHLRATSVPQLIDAVMGDPNAVMPPAVSISLSERQ